MSEPNELPPPVPHPPGSGPPANALRIWEAIAREEGFYVLHSRAQRNNNPGNLEYGPFAASHGGQRSDGRFAIFANIPDGFNALRILLSAKYHSHTLRQFVEEYAPASENDVESYLNNLCTWCHATPDTLVRALL